MYEICYPYLSSTIYQEWNWRAVFNSHSNQLHIFSLMSLGNTLINSFSFQLRTNQQCNLYSLILISNPNYEYNAAYFGIISTQCLPPFDHYFLKSEIILKKNKNFYNVEKQTYFWIFVCLVGLVFIRIYQLPMNPLMPKFFIKKCIHINFF